MSGESGEVEARGFTAQARARVATVWDRLIAHPFVAGMADGTLAPSAYLFYVEQNLLYLPEYARAIAWGAAKAPDDAGLRAFTRSLENIVRVEIPQNERLRERTLALGPRPHPHAGVMAPATLAYASYLLATAARGGASDIQALILPCAWSYGEIARAHRGRVAEHPVYTEWFDFFGGADYHDMVAGMRDELDTRLDAAAPADRGRAGEIFRTATRLELDFWEMALNARHWADLEL